MITWSQEFAIGHVRIDHEHQTFLCLVNDFHLARRSGASPVKLNRILNELSLYARFHFYSEENVMADSGYPDLEAHRLLHYTLIEMLNNKILGLQICAIDAGQVESFLIDWFVQHVTQEDTKIGRHLGQSPTAIPSRIGEL